MKATWVFVVIGLVVAPALPAIAASKAKSCKQQCAGLIDACNGATTSLGFGNLAKSCKASVLKRCKKEGEAVCAAFCGNGVVDGQEKCDGAAFGDATCTSLGFASGTLACAIGCTFDTGGCVARPVELCGNGVKDDGEQCDGDDLGGNECTTFSSPGGELACTSECLFDTTSCDFPATAIGDTANLVGGFSFWQTFASNNPNGFFVDDAILIPDRKDAFDGFWIMSINGTVVNPAAPMSLIRGLTRTSVTAPPVTIAGLQVSQRYTTFQLTSVLRVVLTLTNPTGAPVNVVARATGNFGSDTNTTIAGTSNGDTAATTLDHWVTTFDSSQGSTDPGVVTIFGGPGTVRATPTTVTIGQPQADIFTVEFPVTVPADSTRRLMFLSALTFGGSGGGQAGGLFDDLPQMKEFGLFGGLSAAEQGEIVNWNLPP